MRKKLEALRAILGMLGFLALCLTGWAVASVWLGAVAEGLTWLGVDGGVLGTVFFWVVAIGVPWSLKAGWGTIRARWKGALAEEESYPSMAEYIETFYPEVSVPEPLEEFPPPVRRAQS